MGVPDAKTPFIADEVRAVAGILPDSQVFLGAEATADQLQRHGAESRFVHIATHGLFRKDNAMFSSIRLGDGPLSVYDLYQLQLSAELVTLSGCGTGLSVIVGGDEQLGLVRGLLYAGARAVLLTLWDAHDRSTADFMQTFYGRVQQGWSKARAAQEGMRVLRERAPAPVLLGAFHSHRKCACITCIGCAKLNIGTNFGRRLYLPARSAPLDGGTRYALVAARSRGRIAMVSTLIIWGE